MNKFISLLKASMSQDMNLFKIRANKNASKTKKLIFPILLAFLLMYCVGITFYELAEGLSKVNATFLILSFVFLISVITNFIESIYKSQGILFEGKDNNLLLSLPIKKYYIIIIRLIKLYVFQFLFNLLFFIPAVVLYAMFEKTSILFYVLTLLEAILIPIVPTIIGSFLGYIIKLISSKFKKRKFFQMVFTFTIFFGIYFLSFKSSDWINSIIANSNSINDMITKIYFPIGIYISLINKFSLFKLLVLIISNLLITTIFILVYSYNFDKIIKKESIIGKISKNKKISIKEKSIYKSLINKEIRRYFSSNVYVFNTLFGMILLLLATIGLCINFNGMIKLFTSQNISIRDLNTIRNQAPVVFYALIIGINSLSNITSSSISIERRSFNISKSLPVSPTNIMLSKIISSVLIYLPFILISDLIFCICFRTPLLYTVCIVLVSILSPLVNAFIGILTNLKYPKMNASNDTEVVKQSMSAFISIMVSLLIGGVLIASLFIKHMNILNIIYIELLIMLILCFVFYKVLSTWGKKKFIEIEV